MIRQLDASLHNLDNNPSLTEALARVRAYYAVMNMISRNIERVRAKRESPPATHDQIDQLKKHIYQQYRSLFSRVA